MTCEVESLMNTDATWLKIQKECSL